jgi:hypothetical protein
MSSSGLKISDGPMHGGLIGCAVRLREDNRYNFLDFLRNRGRFGCRDSVCGLRSGLPCGEHLSGFRCCPVLNPGLDTILVMQEHLEFLFVVRSMSFEGFALRRRSSWRTVELALVPKP